MTTTRKRAKTKRARSVANVSRKTATAKTRNNRDRKLVLSVSDIAILDRMLEDGSISEVVTLSASDLATWVHNIGTDLDRAEALVAVLPIARRVYARCN